MISIGVMSVGSGIGHAVLQSLQASPLPARIVGLDRSARNAAIHRADAAALVPPLHRIDEYRERVLEIVRVQHLDAIIPGLDPELTALDSIRAELEEAGCRVISSGSDVIRLSDDKLAMARWCEARGMPFVETFTLPIARLQADSLTYPLVVKPRTGSASRAVRLVLSADELRTTPGDDAWIVQRYLAPPEPESAAMLVQSHEVSAQYSISRDGRVLGAFVSLNRLKAGVPIEVVPMEDDDVLADGLATAQALAAVGARGPVNLQGRRDENGELKLFELNARFTGITGVRTMMGFREVDHAIRSLVLDDDDGARSALRWDRRFVGLRPVGDVIVTAERLEALSTGRRASLAIPKRILLTGATGYIGRSTAAALLTSPDLEELVVLVRSTTGTEQLQTDLHNDERLTFLHGELHDRDLELPHVDVVAHLAADRGVGDAPLDEAHLYEVNAVGSRNLIKSARRAGATRFVLMSTQAVYGTRQLPPWPESLPPAPESPYGMSKWLGELVCVPEHSEHLHLVVLRVARAYGLAPGMRWTELPHALAERTVRGTALEIVDGRQRLDLVAVGDVALAVTAAAGAVLPPGVATVINVGGGAPISVAELAEHYLAATAELGMTPPPVRVRPTKTPPPSFGMDITLARDLLGWSPRVTVEEAVRELVAAARDRPVPTL